MSWIDVGLHQLCATLLSKRVGESMHGLWVGRAKTKCRNVRVTEQHQTSPEFGQCAEQLNRGRSKFLGVINEDVLHILEQVVWNNALSNNLRGFDQKSRWIKAVRILRFLKF